MDAFDFLREKADYCQLKMRHYEDLRQEWASLFSVSQLMLTELEAEAITRTSPMPSADIPEAEDGDSAGDQPE